MKKNFLSYCLSILCLALMAVSCSKNELEDITQNQNEVDGVYTYKLHFNYQVEGEVQTRTSYTWNRNDQVYITFSNGGSSIEGVAKYDGSSWVISSSQPIPVKTSATNCVATFIESGNQDACKLPYQGNGTYTHASSSEDVYVNAIVEPQTWRLRFQGTSGTAISLSSSENDFEYYSSYSSGKIYYSKSNVSLTVSGGYTPYIYGRLLKSGENKITITCNGNSYTRNVTASDLKEGKSAVMSIPTASNYMDLGWQKVEQNPQPAQLYREPCIEWGATKSRVKSFMSGYTLQTEDDEVLLYKGKYKEQSTLYNFGSNGLDIVMVGIADNQTSLSEIKHHLDQSYLFVTEGDDNLGYLSADYSTIIMVLHQSELYVVNYLDASKVLSDKYFDEPYVQWGVSRSTVKSEMAKRGYTIMAESTSASDDYMIAFNGKDQEDYSIYSFTSSQKLDDATVVLNSEVATVEQIRSYFENEFSYTFMGTNSAKDHFFYSSPDGRTCAIASSSTLSSGKVITVADFTNMDNISSGVKAQVKGKGANRNYAYTGKYYMHYSDAGLLEAANKNLMKAAFKRLHTVDFSQYK